MPARDSMVKISLLFAKLEHYIHFHNPLDNRAMPEIRQALQLQEQIQTKRHFM